MTLGHEAVSGIVLDGQKDQKKVHFLLKDGPVGYLLAFLEHIGQLAAFSGERQQFVIDLFHEHTSAMTGWLQRVQKDAARASGTITNRGKPTAVAEPEVDLMKLAATDVEGFRKKVNISDLMQRVTQESR